MNECHSSENGKTWCYIQRRQKILSVPVCKDEFFTFFALQALTSRQVCQQRAWQCSWLRLYQHVVNIRCLKKAQKILGVYTTSKQELQIMLILNSSFLIGRQLFSLIEGYFKHYYSLSNLKLLSLLQSKLNLVTKWGFENLD